jgi:hypothetical protein
VLTIFVRARRLIRSHAVRGMVRRRQNFGAEAIVHRAGRMRCFPPHCCNVEQQQ